MNRRAIAKAIKTATAFLEAAAECQKILTDTDGFIVGNAKSGALRRASMELTRALAEMRKPS